MFSFFHRTPKITVDAFTYLPTVHQLTPITKGTHALPEWFKKLPAPTVGTANPKKPAITNMRRCYGFTELFRKSLIIENWTDLQLEISPKTWKAFVKIGDAPKFHEGAQYNYSFPNYHLIKLESPWALIEKTGLHFTLVEAAWNHDTYDFKILPGVDEYAVQHSTNLFTVWPKKIKKYDVHLPAGLPMVHIIPHTDKNVEVKCHLVDEVEFNKYHLNHMSIAGHRALMSLFNRNIKRNS